MKVECIELYLLRTFIFRIKVILFKCHELKITKIIVSKTKIVEIIFILQLNIDFHPYDLKTKLDIKIMKIRPNNCLITKVG